MKLNNGKKTNVGILVDTPFPHPSLKDKREIMSLCFQLTDSVFDLFNSLVLMGEYSAGEKLLKTSRRVPGNLQIAFAAISINEYKNKLELSMDTLIEIRFWLKEIQMRYINSTDCDNTVDKVNELFKILTYISGKYRIPQVKTGFLTVN